jgi:uncharacterized sodium:solute symporter family permease YidK
MVSTGSILVEKMQMTDIILLFIVFVVIMLIIGYIEKKMKEKAESTKTEEDMKNAKFATYALRFFPMAYVVFLLMYFYILTT